MRKNLLFLLIAISFSCLKLDAQKSYTISGQIFSDEKLALESASVVLFSVADSTFAGFGLTNNAGEFKIADIKAQAYTLQVSFLGFKQYTQLLQVDGEEKKISLEPIYLISNQTLQEVVIEGENIPLLVKKDTFVYNADAFKIQPNDLVEDLLKKMPGIEVESDGTIVAQGEEVTKVLVDGKEFFGTDPKIATKNLPAEAVDKIQFYDKKSDKAEFTGIDDGEEEKTMNLELKKDFKEGIFGTASVAGGIDQQENFRYENRLSLNRFTNKSQLSVIGNLNNINKQGFSSDQYISMMSTMGGFGRGRNSGISVNRGLSDGFVDTGDGGLNFNYDLNSSTQVNLGYFINDINNEIYENTVRENFISSNESFFSDDIVSSISENTGHRMLGTFNNNVDSSHQLKIVLSADINDPSSVSTESLLTVDQDGNQINSIFNQYESQALNRLQNWNSRAIFSKKFGRRILTLVGNYGQGNTDLLGQQISLDSLRSTNDFQHAFTSFDQQQNYKAEIAYVEPLKNGNYLELSYEFSNDGTDYGLTTSDVYLGLTKQIDSLSNINNRDYRYHRYGLSWQRNSEKSNITIETNIQQSQLNGEYSIPRVIGDPELIQTVKNPNFAILPALSWRYELGQSQRLRFNYSTSVREPSLEQLQLRSDISDPLNIYIGNPDLQMEYRHRMRLRYSLFDQFNFSSFFAFLSGTYTQNKITNQTLIGQNFVKTTSPVNVADDLSLSARMNYSTPIRALKIKTRISSNLSYQKNIVFLNSQATTANRYVAGMGLSFENRKKDMVDAEIGGRWNYNTVQYAISDGQNVNFFNQRYFANVAVTGIEKWTIKSGINVDFYSEEDFGEAQIIPIWTMSVSRYILKGNRGELRLSAFDILNKNVGISRTSNLNYIENQEINSLGRYVLMTFAYNIRGFSKENSSGGRGRGRGPR